jgi:hypothetical protein
MGHPRSKRRILARPRRPSFGVEILRLFAELERTPPRARGSDSFRAKDQELARLLGLEIELDRSMRPSPAGI